MGHLVAVDSGRNSTKVKAQGRELFHFPSYIGSWADRENPEYVEGDVEMEYQGIKYFIGKLAKRESDDYYQPMKESKAELETVLLTLAAFYLAGIEGGKIDLVTGVPVNRYKKDKDKLKEMLKGTHEVIINGKPYTYHIDRILISLEGGASFYQYPKDGLARIIDIGSRTTNIVTYEDYVFVNRDSDTLDTGWETYKKVSENNAESLAKFIAGQTSRRRWNRDDFVLLVGGAAHLVEPYIRQHFPNAVTVDEPRYSNVKGYYALGASKHGKV